MSYMQICKISKSSDDQTVVKTVYGSPRAWISIQLRAVLSQPAAAENRAATKDSLSPI